MSEHALDRVAALRDEPFTTSLALRPPEAARALGISCRKLWELTADEQSGIPHVQLGRSVRYPVRELADWLKDQAAREVGR